MGTRPGDIVTRDRWTVLVVGATGSIGRLAVAEAIRQGYGVRALVRNPGHVRQLPSEAQVVRGDLTRPDTLAAAVDGVDAIVFAHGSTGGGKAGFESVDYGGVRNVLSALGSRRVRIALFQASDPARASGASVLFEAGARTAWHAHPLGQTLVVTARTGWVQQSGEAATAIREGNVVWIPPGVKHWHGATATTAMTHIAVQERLDDKTVAWMEQVSDEQYRAARAGALRLQKTARR